MFSPSLKFSFSSILAHAFGSSTKALISSSFVFASTLIVYSNVSLSNSISCPAITILLRLLFDDLYTLTTLTLYVWTLPFSAVTSILISVTLLVNVYSPKPSTVAYISFTSPDKVTLPT